MTPPSFPFYVDESHYQLIKHGEELCGDNVGIVRHPSSFIAVLADGLGSGVKANILSTMTTKIACTMLERGGQIEDVVETIVETLPVCQVRKLAYSTFNILRIDYASREAYLVEFDTPPTFIFRKGRRFLPRREERMINGRRILESRFPVEEGDLLVMVSDGVIHAGVGGILNLGWQWENVNDYLERLAASKDDAYHVAKMLTTVCENLYVGKPGDDATVLALSVRPRGEVTLLSGPPADQSLDHAIVERFMESPGFKVICGGTTAKIVARETGRELTANLDMEDPDVPPTASMPGIDLVTEGVLTISKAVEILKEALALGAPYREFRRLERRDGAARLAKILIRDCTKLTLIVGRAVNPAHQNPNLPKDLAIRVKVIESLADLMVRLGKEVEIIYY